MRCDLRSNFCPRFGSSSDNISSLATRTSATNLHEVTFTVRRTLYGRHGWIVMPSDESIDLKSIDQSVMLKLSEKIKDLEFSGKDIPKSITMKVKE